MNGFQIVLLIHSLLVAVFLVIGYRNKEYKEFVKEYGEGYQLNFMAPGSLYILDHMPQRLFPELIQHIHEKIIRIHGSIKAPRCTRIFLAQTISAILLIPLAIMGLTVLGEGGIEAAVFAYLTGPIVAIILVKDLDGKVNERERAILFELPEFLNRIILLVNAGENVQDALMRSIENKLATAKSQGNKKINPLYRELEQTLFQLKNNRSFSDAMEDFSKRCAVHEVSLFTTTVILNMRRGGGDFVSSLRELSRDLWSKRTAVARTLGEEASSKLVFPMVIIFIVVMVIVATPAFMFM